MSRPYYYFVASLPMLEFDKQPPMTVEAFVSDCHRLLSDEDSTFIQQLILEDGREIIHPDQALQAIVRYNRNYYNALVWFRSQRAGQDPAWYLRGDQEKDFMWTEIFVRAAKLSNLLEGEKILDYARWRGLDNLITGHQFDMAYLAAYGLKLKILERYRLVYSTKGSQFFEELKQTEYSKKY